MPESLQQRLTGVLDRHGLQYNLEWIVGGLPFLTRPGGLIVADNVVRGGRIAEDPPPDEAIEAQRRLHRELADDARAEATTIQTVGVKG